MAKYYQDYTWKEGKPRGLPKTSEEPPLKGIAYKIVADPYYKRISIEKYQDGSFASIIYDSALFDFRHLKPAEQTAWRKDKVNESDRTVICHIRNQDDRLILIETYTFEHQLCRECRSSTPHGVLVSVQKIQYVSLGDTFNGVTLYDSNDHIVMFKKYKTDEAGEFTELLLESWDQMQG